MNNFTIEQMNELEVGKVYTSWKQVCISANIPYKLVVKILSKNGVKTYE